MKKIAKFLQSITNYFQFLCWRYFPIFRPSNIKFSGKFYFSFKSRLKINKNSKISIVGNFDITDSQLFLTESALNANYFICSSSLLVINKSDIKFGEKCHIKNSNINIEHSQFVAGSNLRVFDTKMNVENSKLSFDNFMMFEANLNYKPMIEVFNGKFQCGVNCKIQASMSIQDGEFKLGSHSFINFGTIVSCKKYINIGSYVMISYYCTIFDNNSHLADFKMRRAEIDQGFPNGTKQNAENKPMCKDVIIGDDVWIGIRSVILKGVNIGNAAVVGAASIVTKDIKEGETFVNKINYE